MAEELPSEEQAREELARWTAMRDQMRAHRESDAEMLGHFRDALTSEGFSERGAESLVLAYYTEWLSWDAPVEAEPEIEPEEGDET